MRRNIFNQPPQSWEQQVAKRELGGEREIGVVKIFLFKLYTTEINKEIMKK